MIRPALAAALVLLSATAAQAQYGPWAGPGWGGAGWGGSRWNDRPAASPSRRDEREGRVDVSRFVAEGEGVKALGHGSVVVSSSADGADPADSRQLATFEAAVVDRLAAAGYDTAARTETGGQAVELRIARAEVRPAETKRKPVSGEMAVGAGNRGSMMGMAVNIDLSKPAKALHSTRLEARIRDRASGAALWEGRAEIITRDGDERWSDQAIATRLAGALFDRFPQADES